MRLKNEVDEKLSLDSINNISSNEKELERLRRNVNLRELENKELVKKLTKQDIEIHYLRKRNNTLAALEKSLPQRIENYKKKNAPDEVIRELQFINNMLMMEKEKLLNREVEDEESND